MQRRDAKAALPDATVLVIVEPRCHLMAKTGNTLGTREGQVWTVPAGAPALVGTVTQQV